MSQPQSNKTPAPNKGQQQAITVDDVLKVLRNKKLKDVFTDDQLTELFSGATNRQVGDLHRNADTDLRPDAIHHTLGQRQTQASPGSHSHNGGDSVFLMDNVVFTGSRSSATATVLAQVLTALASTMGATDSTSA